MANRDGKKAYDEEAWYYDVAEYMVRQDVNFSVACQALGIKMANSAEERKHERRKSFQRRYQSVRNSFYEAIGSDPSLNKSVVIGVLTRTIQRLEEKGDFDKVATAAKVLSEIAGWTKPEVGTSVVLGLNQAELDAVKAKLRILQNAPEANETDKPN
jgi:hypothetical protein